MDRKVLILLFTLLVVSNVLSYRVLRAEKTETTEAPKVDTSKSDISKLKGCAVTSAKETTDTSAKSTSKKAKRDVEAAETIVDPYLYGGAHLGPGFVGGYGYPIGVGAGLGHIGAVAPIGLGYGGLGYGKFIGPEYIKSGGGYGGGIVSSGINEGGLALGNQGQQILQQSIGGGFSDGGYHNGGQLKQGGYGGGEIYNDNKNAIADNHINQGYYSGVQGGRKDLGNGEIFNKKSAFAQNGVNQIGDEAYKGYKKGHHKTGFHKSYHKDESGNDESFYDSDHDEGNHELGNKYGGYYDNNVINNLNGGHKLNEYAAQEAGKIGQEGIGKLLAQNQGIRDYYGKNNFYDNANGYGQFGGGKYSNFGKAGGQHGYLGGFNNGRNFEALQGSKFGGGGGFIAPFY